MLPSTTSPSENPISSLSPSAASSPAQFSCILCKQRKVRCDRANPCSGCVRAGVQCEPGVRQPYKRRKRNDALRDGDSLMGSHSDSISSRALERRPMVSSEEPRAGRPQVPTFGQYVAASYPSTHTSQPFVFCNLNKPGSAHLIQYHEYTVSNIPTSLLLLIVGRNLWTGLNEEVRHPSPSVA